MKQVLLQILLVGMGTFGFSLLFGVSRRLYLWTTLGGMMSWLVYILLSRYFDMRFFPCLLASAFAAIYAEIMARIMKAPAILFLTASLIPAVPGSALFYTMRTLVSQDWSGMRLYGTQTLMFAVAIAAGVSIIWAMMSIINRLDRKK